VKSLWKASTAWVLVALALFLAPVAQARPGPLVDVAWLQQKLAAGEVLVLDAQPRMPRWRAAGAEVTQDKSALPLAGLARVYIAAGSASPASPPARTVIHFPGGHPVNSDGSVKAGAELWAAVARAGVPRHAQWVFVAGEPGDAAMNYTEFQLMGYPNLRVLLR
jgi:hypothetical protein